MKTRDICFSQSWRLDVQGQSSAWSPAGEGLLPSGFMASDISLCPVQREGQAPWVSLIKAPIRPWGLWPHHPTTSYCNPIKGYRSAHESGGDTHTHTTNRLKFLEYLWFRISLYCLSIHFLWFRFYYLILLFLFLGLSLLIPPSFPPFFNHGAYMLTKQSLSCLIL